MQTVPVWWVWAWATWIHMDQVPSKIDHNRWYVKSSQSECRRVWPMAYSFPVGLEGRPLTPWLRRNLRNLRNLRCRAITSASETSFGGVSRKQSPISIRLKSHSAWRCMFHHVPKVSEGQVVHDSLNSSSTGTTFQPHLLPCNYIFAQCLVRVKVSWVGM